MKSKIKILITAGPTWTKLDDVRILTNIFTGRTGVNIAKALREKGAAVTLFFNPHCIGKNETAGLKTVCFRYYDEFKEKVVKELKDKKYDVIIHTAAVSDYKPKRRFNGKLPSGREDISLPLVPTEKIIKIMRGLASKAVIIQFKLENKRKCLIDKSYKSLVNNRTDFVVANALEDLDGGYKAFIIDREKNTISVDSKATLFNKIFKIIKMRISNL